MFSDNLDPYNDGKLCCPYNILHRFDKTKFQFHVVRCKDKARVGHLFGHCQYYFYHIVKKEELKLHEENCPFKKED